MDLVVATYLRTRIEGNMHTWLSMGQPCRMKQTENGYKSVEEMRKELISRNKNSHAVEEIPGGLRLTPLPGLGHAYAYQDVTLE
jgi:hypothetical protein